MFNKIQHIGYHVRDLDAAIAWFGEKFGAAKVTTGPSRSGRNGFVRFGQIEAELIQPTDNGDIPPNALVMQHVGYVVDDIMEAVGKLKEKGFKFEGDKPRTNMLGQQLLYFDANTTNGVLIHLSQNVNKADTAGYGQGLPVEYILHAGYIVANLEEAVAWYEEKFDGKVIGGLAASRGGGRNTYVNFGQTQVELIERADPALTGGRRYLNDHAGWVVSDIKASIAACRGKGLKFVADAPNTNRIGQQLLYFDAASVQGARIHLSQMPD